MTGHRSKNNEMKLTTVTHACLHSVAGRFFSVFYSMYVCVRVCIHVLVCEREFASIDAHLEAGGQLGKLVLSSHSAASEGATQVIRLRQQVLLPTEPSFWPWRWLSLNALNFDVLRAECLCGRKEKMRPYLQCLGWLLLTQ